MIPPWAAKLEVTEQSLKRHRMAAFQPSGSATVRAITLSLQVFLYLLLDHSLLDCSKQLLCCNAPHCFVGLASKYFVGKEGIWSRCFVDYGQIRSGSCDMSGQEAEPFRRSCWRK